MGEMFQLSIELYDTKKSNILWSDRWQEKWENLVNIQSSISDGLLQALALKTNTIEKVLSDNPEAYEHYLKAIHKNSTKKSRADLLMARELYKKAYEIDKDFIYAKIAYAGTFAFEEYKEGVSILEEILASSHAQSDKAIKARTLMAIAGCYFFTSHKDKAKKYNQEALELYSEIGDKNRVAQLTVNLSGSLLLENSYDEGIKMCLKGIEISKELEDQHTYAGANMNLAYINAILGKDETSFKYLNIAEPILKKVNDYFFLGFVERIKAVNYFNQRDFESAIKYFKISDSSNSSIHDTTIPPIETIQSFILSDSYPTAIKLLEEKKYTILISSDNETEGNNILFKILYSIVMNNKDNDIRTEVDDYGKQPELDKDPMFIWMFYYWAFVLFKDKNYINLSHNYLVSFSDNIPDDSKASFLQTTIPKMIAEAWEKIK